MKFGTIVLQEKSHQLTDADFWYDVICSRRQLWHNFMQKSAATLWVEMQQQWPVSDPEYIQTCCLTGLLILN